VGESERPGNDPGGTRRGCFLPDLTRVDKAPVRRRPLAGYLMGRVMGGKAAAAAMCAVTASVAGSGRIVVLESSHQNPNSSAIAARPPSASRRTDASLA
jgi:hypothetical protein